MAIGTVLTVKKMVTGEYGRIPSLKSLIPRTKLEPTSESIDDSQEPAVAADRHYHNGGHNATPVWENDIGVTTSNHIGPRGGVVARQF